MSNESRGVSKMFRQNMEGKLSESILVDIDQKVELCPTRYNKVDSHKSTYKKLMIFSNCNAVIFPMLSEFNCKIGKNHRSTRWRRNSQFLETTNIVALMEVSDCKSSPRQSCEV